MQPSFLPNSLNSSTHLSTSATDSPLADKATDVPHHPSSKAEDTPSAHSRIPLEDDPSLLEVAKAMGIVINSSTASKQ